MRDAAIAIIRAIGVETGGSNIQFAVDPETGRMIVVEMNPRVSPQLGPGLQGHRLPHRQDRRQAGRRLHARRDPQRHHQEDAGLLRADHRLLRGQDPALDLREVPRGRRDAHHADEERRRGHVHRPDVQGSPAEGHPLDGGQAVRPGPGRQRQVAGRADAGSGRAPATASAETSGAGTSRQRRPRGRAPADTTEGRAPTRVAHPAGRCSATSSPAPARAGCTTSATPSRWAGRVEQVYRADQDRPLVPGRT